LSRSVVDEHFVELEGLVQCFSGITRHSLTSLEGGGLLEERTERNGSCDLRPSASDGLDGSELPSMKIEFVEPDMGNCCEEPLSDAPVQ
jgi:hypothetical protein